jgi:hypothetical protein
MRVEPSGIFFPRGQEILEPAPQCEHHRAQLMRTSLAGRAFVWLAALSSLVSGAKRPRRRFPRRRKRQAPFAAVAAGNYPLSVYRGPEMAGFWSTDDPSATLIERDRFLDAARTGDSE